MRMCLTICFINTGANSVLIHKLRLLKLIEPSADSQQDNSQLIQLKGSTPDRVKQYQNCILLETIRKKMQTQVPNRETRKELWVQFTQLYQKPHFYNNLKHLQVAPEFLVSIKKDINRTFRSEQTKAKTQQVLQVFAQYNPYIGYCQGMNTIIAFLIDQGFTCQQAFFIFKRISEDLLPCDYYNNMDSIMAYMRIFYQILSVTHPKSYAKMKLISKQMENSYIAMVSFVLQWFVCIFCNDNVHVNVTRIIWDFFLTQGITALLKAGIVMFDYLQPHILQCYSYQSYNEMQKQYLKTITDHERIRNTMTKMYISPDILFLLKQKLTSQDEKAKKQELKNKKFKIDHKKCNRKWNVCFQTLQNNLQNGSPYDYFVFKAQQQPLIVDNYLQKLHQQYFNKQKIKSNDVTTDLMIGRIQHTCQYEQDLLTEDSISMSQKSVEERSKERSKAAKSVGNPKSPNKWVEDNIRKKAAEKIQQCIKKKAGMERSESIIFMQKMVQNVSISNLLQLYQIDQMFQ